MQVLFFFFLFFFFSGDSSCRFVVLVIMFVFLLLKSTFSVLHGVIFQGCEKKSRRDIEQPQQKLTYHDIYYIYNMYIYIY